MTRAIYPGTFDPVHNGHIDVVQRAVKIFDQVVVAVYDHPMKSLFFETDERLALVDEALHGIPRVSCVSYNGLTVDFARQLEAQVIVRGLRVFSDFEFEFRWTLTNKRLAPDIEVVCLITDEEHTFLSSTIIREIASFKGDVRSMVPLNVAVALETRFDGHEPGYLIEPQSLRD